MWSVVVTLKGKNGELTEMVYLNEGGKYSAIHSAMTALSDADTDVEWVTIERITINHITDED